MAEGSPAIAKALDRWWQGLIREGFTEPFRACCGHGGKYNYNKNHGCGLKIIKGGNEVRIGKSCKDPQHYVNWDGVHFTEAAITSRFFIT
ncbi:hypothetical protein CRG98_048491 [Punica granatum]|uniref:GDSL esterase/lipase n=1 Tax=Punica granatum TaxID=22663 RepID=A0A2I0HHN0_PUNGR|nr:hypothetical protein CRG98_048491 [Punica granatum]